MDEEEGRDHLNKDIRHVSRKQRVNNAKRTLIDARVDLHVKRGGVNTSMITEVMEKAEKLLDEYLEYNE